MCLYTLRIYLNLLRYSCTYVDTHIHKYMPTDDYMPDEYRSKLVRVKIRSRYCYINIKNCIYRYSYIYTMYLIERTNTTLLDILVRVCVCARARACVF